ncbi:type II toxin-antitoxin system PemK/MazF family toxin [Scytonema sp. UIC 10036]|uniref:type II toxin-antitoxin system PemK/MazF family toxin n=1 Tax=Scytonema sp. UIC 10036 TaxID=2304196 RepID=UPI0012DAEE8C|nr:type II toxin-antitoxin system PemK/MazF family toxin [Scytonema sp. UIC 10036]MUH00858.1 type II toxin-antitoxin system PemK/MazF family toxin [Scytonema sp. UIC 10036]
MPLKKGDVILAPFPFTDLSQTKLRPAVVLWVSSTGSNDIVICFISSQNLTNLKPEEFLIGDSDSELINTGLKVTSKVIVSRLVTIDRNLITRRLGNLGTNQLQELNTRLIQIFQL